VTPEQRIDAALDSVLKASGSALRHYTMPKTLADMREAMRKVMFDEYIRGLNDNVERAHGIKTSHNLCLSCGHSIDAHDRQYGCAEDGLAPGLLRRTKWD